MDYVWSVLYMVLRKYNSPTLMSHLITSEKVCVRRVQQHFMWQKALIVYKENCISWGRPQTLQLRSNSDSVQLPQSVQSTWYTHIICTQWLFRLEAISPNISLNCLPASNEKFYMKFAQVYTWFIQNILSILKIPKIYIKSQKWFNFFFFNFSKYLRLTNFC